jgi:hypothetical protein
MPQGNGDLTLVEFGRKVSPNHHALAEQFVKPLDNYYGPGDQSALGHRWSLQAYPSTWFTSTGTLATNQSPMLLGPTDAIYDQAKARADSAGLRRARREHDHAGECHLDGHLQRLKFGTTKVGTLRVRIIVGLRDVYHPRYPAAESRVPDQYRADIFLKEFAEFEKNGKLRTWCSF